MAIRSHAPTSIVKKNTGTKRVLKISPSTPTDGHLKVAIVDEASPALKEAPGRSRCLSFTAFCIAAGRI